MTKGRKQDLPAPTLARGDEPQAASSFELGYTEDAAGDIKRLDGSVKKRLRRVLEKKLAVDPEGYGLPLRGALAGYWKHEFATHRIIYRIYKDHRIVAVCAVGPRKQGDAEDIYNQLNAVAETGRLAHQIATVLKKILPKNK
jgi:mRNA-degrading endonuclease RelE of RelBE toxin-antitoxin system